MRFKKPRLGPQLLAAASSPGFFDQVHVIFGGTGAVGGATALALIDLFEEAAARSGYSGGSPRIIATGRTRSEVRRFTSLLFALQERDHGRRPEHLEGRGYRTVGGVVVELCVFGVDPSIPELSSFAGRDESEQRQAADALLAHGGLGVDASAEDRAELLARAVRERVGAPFTEFLEDYLERNEELPGGRDRFRSVTVGIPLASVATYKLGDLEAAGPYFGVEPGSERMEALKAAYLEAIRDDLAGVADRLAEEVLAAHTTGVGGMYDEEPGGERTIRLGFAHSALGAKLSEKQVFAEHLSDLYAERGIKMLATAAAIGVDAVMMGKSPPINGAVRAALSRAVKEGSEVVPEADVGAGVARCYEPVDFALIGEETAEVKLAQGTPIVMDHVLKSGENGFFSVANTDALYRVMRVVSSTELGLLLARTALFGDDEYCPSFPNNVCYYTETDNSRQVFDLLDHPQLRDTQLSGLSPAALQDLGSAKHQGELHTLGLLLLLHRLISLDLDGIPHPVDLESFDPRAYFRTHSKVLTLDQAVRFDAEALAHRLTTLATAREVEDLERLQSYYQADPERNEAARRVLQAVLRAVWSVPSLGSPILYRGDAGERRVVVGYYAAPLDRVITHTSTLEEQLRQSFAEHGGGDEAAFDRHVEFHIANAGFVDLRPIAVLVTARSPAEGLAGKVEVFDDEESFRKALDRVEPYSYFATSGLLALLTRLKGLARQASELDLRFGSSNLHRAHFSFDDLGRPLLLPGLVEAFRMVSEGLSKNTGSDRLDGRWGYGAV